MTVIMRKQSAFDNIPTLPKTFSGQWMTFSHMANHYRKLLNVKPRVDTGIPHPLAASERKLPLKPTKTKSTKPERPSTTEYKAKSKWTRQRTSSELVDYDYHTLPSGFNKSTNGSFKAGSSSDGYQIVFGPSSIKSSVDAMNSDHDPEPDLLEPKVSSISIGEKIRKFLDNIHAQESQLRLAGSRPLEVTRERKLPSKPKEMREPRANRHSKCFTPFQVSPTGTKKRVVKPSSATHHHHPHQHHLSTETLDFPVTDSRPRTATTSAKSYASPKVSSKVISSNQTRKNSNKKTGTMQDIFTTLKNSTPAGRMASRKGTKKQMESPAMSPRSVSVGTIHGSEELVEEFMVPSALPRNLSTIQIDTGDISADWLKERVERGVVRINNAYFSLAPGTSTSSLGIHHHPNKDSSRDSAYGFSSGESRITTRESTPEKKAKSPKSAPGSSFGATGNNGSCSRGQYKSSLSTVDSSINQDNSSHIDSSGRSSCSEKSIPPKYIPSSSRIHSSLKSDERYRWISEQKYIHFLTTVTDDIVSRGIFTNKGIKNIFKAHIMKNQELEMDKMLYLLERLRMDMGVPKDDSLNQLDFGYGSVDYSTEPYFFKKKNKEDTESSGAEENESLDDIDPDQPTTDDNGNNLD